MTKRKLGSVEEAILTQLKNISTQHHMQQSPSPIWTQAVVEMFHKLAATQKPAIRCVTKARPREFLWDVVWIEPQGGSVHEPWFLKLACEIEWNGADCALYDFHKLVFSTAALRVMIFDAEFPDRFDEKLEQMLKVLEKDTPDKDYLFLGIRSNYDHRANIDIVRHYACRT